MQFIHIFTVGTLHNWEAYRIEHPGSFGVRCGAVVGSSVYSLSDECTNLFEFDQFQILLKDGTKQEELSRNRGVIKFNEAETSSHVETIKFIKKFAKDKPDSEINPQFN